MSVLSVFVCACVREMQGAPPHHGGPRAGVESRLACAWRAAGSGPDAGVQRRRGPSHAAGLHHDGLLHAHVLHGRHHHGQTLRQQVDRILMEYNVTETLVKSETGLSLPRSGQSKCGCHRTITASVAAPHKSPPYFSASGHKRSRGENKF